METKNELIPCPFCGGNDVELQNSFAGSKKPVCMDCGASLHPSRSEEAAIEEWNIRVYPPEVQAAIERDTPKRPLNISKKTNRETEIEFDCPACFDHFDWLTEYEPSPKVCIYCGQRLDWDIVGRPAVDGDDTPRKPVKDILSHRPKSGLERRMTCLTSPTASRYSDPVLEKNSTGIGVPCFQGAHRLNHVSSGFFVRRHGTLMGGLCRASSDAPLSLDAVRQPVQSCPPRLASGTASFRNLSKESTMSALVFHGVTFSPVTLNKIIYITSAQLAEALGYANDRAVSKIYNRNADEFTEDMSIVPGAQFGNRQEARLFSLRGAHLVAMFSRTPIAKEFRKWVLDVLDRETNHHSKHPEPNLLNKNEFARVREITGRYFDDFGAALKAGKTIPTLDIPEDVLAGIVAQQLWKTSFALYIDYDGTLRITPQTDPYESITKAIADPGNIGLKDEVIEKVAQACVIALAHRAKRRSEVIAKFHKN